MKKVFSNHSEVCHIWAQQTHSEGRAGNIFFIGSDIYSYGLHFKAGKIHTIKGKTFALVNSHNYSSSTIKHLHAIRDSVNGLMPYFDSPKVDSPKDALIFLDAHAQSSTLSPLKRLKVTDKQSIRWEFERIHYAFKTANELRKILGKAEKWPTKKQLDAVQAHLEKRLARYKELNTPEMIEKRKAESAKRELRRAELESKKQAENIAKFRNGEPVSLRGLCFDLLRIKDDTVQTSRGASVPLPDALRLFRALQSGKNFSDTRVGNFTFQSIDRTLADPVVTIGCHRILMSEAESLFGAPKLRLVTAS